ncbi:hypothetical protein Omen_065 [Erwinia phage Omen]|uniref:Uncharacterized protein n=1 Tax=Erwinia phage Harbringer TaxID=3158978 RepID=A0AAU8EI38_9CAUD
MTENSWFYDVFDRFWTKKLKYMVIPYFTGLFLYATLRSVI